MSINHVLKRFERNFLIQFAGCFWRKTTAFLPCCSGKAPSLRKKRYWQTKSKRYGIQTTKNDKVNFKMLVCWSYRVIVDWLTWTLSSFTSEISETTLLSCRPPQRIVSSVLQLFVAFPSSHAHGRMRHKINLYQATVSCAKKFLKIKA